MYIIPQIAKKANLPNVDVSNVTLPNVAFANVTLPNVVVPNVVAAMRMHLVCRSVFAETGTNRLNVFFLRFPLGCIHTSDLCVYVAKTH